ncbi:MAG: MipA/OmpV family protein [Alphaproteobacteria bacterium]
MRTAAFILLACTLAAAPATAREGGLRLVASDLLEITPGIQHDAQDDSGYLSQLGFLGRRGADSQQLADTLVLQSLPAFEAEIVRGAGFSAGLTARSNNLNRRSLFRNRDYGRKPDGGVGAYGTFSVDELTFTARLAQETTDGHGGFVADLGLKWASQIMENLTLVVGSEISWADQNYMESFFGNARNAPGGGLRLHDASPGFKDVTVSGSVTYSIGDNWTVGGLIGAQRFLGGATSSPTVREEREYFGGVSLGVRF